MAMLNREQTTQQLHTSTDQKCEVYWIGVLISLCTSPFSQGWQSSDYDIIV
jgi:hypothetical protein